MENNIDVIVFKCIEVEQPIGTFYLGTIDSKDLVSISYADVRRIEERDVEKYLGIQRPLSPNRVKELQQYVNVVDATFPTGVILAVNSIDCEYDDKKGRMLIRKDNKVAKIIDGQHRIAGLEAFKGDKFQVNTILFVDMDIEDQAMVFATINLKHTKVSKSLMYDLFDFAKSRSPQKSSHNIAKLLNTKDNSPFKNKIKILGVASGHESKTLTQSTFVESIMKYISKEPNDDRDKLKRGKPIKKISETESHKLIFRNLFLENNDQIIAKITWNYFEAVAKRWPKSWNVVEKGNILNRSTGFLALMRFLRPVYLSLGKPGDLISVDKFVSIFKKVNISDGQFTPDNYKPGSSGQGQFYRKLCDQTGIDT